jgi:CRISPR-associated protein Csb2
VIVTQVSAHLGVPPARSFPSLRRKDGGPRLHTHAILIFDQPICGPLMIGAGRYRGYGVCRPMIEPDGEIER